MTQDNGTSDVRNSARAQGVESGAVDGLGVALCSPGSPSAADGLRGAQRGAERVSDAEEAEWARLAGEATEGPWRSAFYGDRDEWELSAEFVIVSCREPDTLSDADAAFIAAARTAVPRLLAEREALRAEVYRLRGQAPDAG